MSRVLSVRVGGNPDWFLLSKVLLLVILIILASFDSVVSLYLKSVFTKKP